MANVNPTTGEFYILVFIDREPWSTLSSYRSDRLIDDTADC